MAAAAFDAPLERLLTPLDQALLREHRRWVLGGAAGRVLELGPGTYPDLYPALPVDELTVVSSGPPPRSRAFPVRAVRRLDDAEPPYDTVVAMFVLSPQRDLGATLAVLRTLLAPNGRLRFLDTTRRRPPSMTDLTRPALRLFTPGPAPDLPAALRRARLTVTDLERFGLPGLSLRSLARGVARPARPRAAPAASARAPTARPDKETS